MYSHIKLIKPVQKIATGSRYIDYFANISAIKESNKHSTSETMISSLLLPQPVSAYPLTLLDDKGKLPAIDKKAYYSNLHLGALELA